MTRSRAITAILGAALLTVACAGADGEPVAAGDGGGTGSSASETVRVGAIYPLTGASAATGKVVLDGVRLATEIVNNEYPDVDLPLASESGLPGLGGAKVEVVSADHEGSPEKGASETERLVTSEGVVAVIGAYFSSVTQTASERAERLGIPFVNGASSAPGLTEDRDLSSFFRVGPSDRTFGEAFFDFLDGLRADKGIEASRLALLYENTAYGSDAAEVTQQMASERGYEIVETVPHGNEVSDVTPEATQVCASDADAVFQASYTPEAILFTKTFAQLGCTPTILAYGAGYADVAYFESVGDLGEYVISRAAWTLDAVRDRPGALRVAELFSEEFGQPMDENSARSFTAAMTLFRAIDAAGSAEPDSIREALAALELPAEETIMPWDGVRFDEQGQNERARGIVVQHLDSEYRLVWPFGEQAADVVWPAPPYDGR